METTEASADGREFFRVALYAAAVFERFRTSGVAQEDLDLVLPVADASAESNLRVNHIAALIVALCCDGHHRASAVSAFREALHQGRSDYSAQDLQNLGYLLESIAQALMVNGGAPVVREAFQRWIGLFTVEERRSYVVELVDPEAGTVLTDHDAKRLMANLTEADERFATLSVPNLRDVVSQISTEMTRGGRKSSGARALGTLGACAKLSVACGAFGDTAEKASKSAFQGAWRAQERKLATKKAAALAEVDRVRRRNSGA